MNNRTTTFRRRFGATSLLTATVLFSAAELLFPTNGNDPAGQLADNAAHHGQLLLAIACGLVASILFIPAFFALMNPVRRRGTALTHVGGGLALLGNALSGLALVGVWFILYEASSPGVDRASLVPFIHHATQDPVGAPFMAGHYFFVLGIILLAVGLIRARVGYRWAAACLGLAPLLDAVLGTIGLDSTALGEIVVSALTDGLFVAGAAGLAWWLATSSNAAWEAAPEISPAPAAETVAA
jgi:hypothetical protein